ncbi:MAG: AarF/ABC1/UbiB kinase family protein [Polyangiaceae bacterium]|nr:AarF/ABC1/UbiB kinase family protein [Polyangiaceae bacterium]
MSNTTNDRLERFRSALRKESTSTPGHGLGRFARLVRGGAGLAAGVLSASRKGAEASLDERDWRKLETLVTQLGELKGLPMKMGQIMSTLEVDLPDEARRLLGLLQTQSPATPFGQVERVLREDLGRARADALLAGLEREPVAVASIGQVHRARLPDGASVAVKVRHPDIEQAIRSDLRGAALGTGFAGALVPGMAATAREFVQETRTRFLEECDYLLEASRQQLFRSFYAGHPVIVVPEVSLPWCGPRVLTTRWETGLEFDAFAKQASQRQRDVAGAALFELYVGTLYRHGVFHADPHPGNYVFRDDGRVVVFDYGCVRVFEPDAARAFVALAQAVRSDDRGRICAALRGLGSEPSSNDATYEHLRRLLRSFFGPMLSPGARRVDGRIAFDLRRTTRDKLALARLRLPGRFMFLFRIRFGLYGVLSRLGAVCDWGALEQGFAEQAGPAGLLNVR